MRKLAVVVASTWLLALPKGARAESGVEPFLKPAPKVSPESGFSLGARLGFGLPLGDVWADTAGVTAPLGDQFKGELPIWIDAGYRFARNWFVGAYLQLGIGIVNKDKLTACAQSGNSCKSSDVRLGVEGTYAFSPGQTFNPWVGLGTGYEWANLQIEGPGGSGEIAVKGWEFFNLQVGGDFLVSSVFGIGPYAAFSLGQYSTGTITVGSASLNGDITNKKVHGWLQLGVRGTFNF